MPVLICLLYLLLHAGLYFLTRRDRPALGSEKGIFWYHVVSAAIVTGVFRHLGACDRRSRGVDVVCRRGDATRHLQPVISRVVGIGGRQLFCCDHGNRRPARYRWGAALIQGLEAIGMSKQTSRLDALQAIGLIRPGRDGAFALTSKGRVAVGLGRTLLFLANVRKYG